MIQVVTAVRRVFVQCLFPKCVIDVRSLMYFIWEWGAECRDYSFETGSTQVLFLQHILADLKMPI